MLNLDSFVGKVKKGECVFPEYVATADKNEQGVIIGQKVYLDCQICNYGQHDEFIEVKAYDSDSRKNLVWEYECSTSCGYEFPFTDIDK